VTQSLEELKRRLNADPGNQALFESLMISRSRVEGGGVFTEVLADRLLWNRCSRALQDRAIAEVALQLGPDYRLQGKARDYSCGGECHRLASFEHGVTGMIFQLIPAGDFLMGPLAQHFLKEGEPRRRQVVIERPFLLGRYPVLQKEWDRLGGEDSRVLEGDDYPIDLVSWESLIDWLERAGSGFRLAGEKEWEYACRAGTRTRRFWGAEMDDSYCWHFENSAERAHGVLEHGGQWNAFGLIDMLGNVLEFCADEWDGLYRSGPNAHLPPSLTAELNHILRGSSRCQHIPGASSATRFVSSTRASVAVGFRVARSL
jgi:formylglycine-generating enzyme required for sulfatase activity